jgi:hypothetical protein
MEPIECCICDETIKEVDSHNAYPVKEGRCCGLCNLEYVIPKRMGMIVLDFEITQQKGNENGTNN